MMDSDLIGLEIILGIWIKKKKISPGDSNMQLR